MNAPELDPLGSGGRPVRSARPAPSRGSHWMDGMNAFRTLLAAIALATALPAAPAIAQDAARGKELFKLCQQCHGEHGGGNPETLAPAIAGLPEWFVEAQILKFQAGGR